MSRRILYPLFFLTIIIFSLPQISNSITITDTLGSAMDNTLYQDEFGQFSNGAGTHFFAGTTASGMLRRGLILFRVENRIPADAIITSVRLRLYMSRSAGLAGPRRIDLHRVLKQWGEGSSFAGGEEGSGAPPEPNDATWLHNLYDIQLWSNTGGDYDSASSGNVNVDAVGYYEWSSSAMINDVTNWINNGNSNAGWLLTGDEDNSLTTKRFDTKENSVPSFRPKLIVTYTTNSTGLALTALTQGYWHGTDGGFVLPDTLRVYLRSSSPPYGIVDSAKKFHGIFSNFTYSVPTGSYYIMVRQRNHIDTWSKLPVSLVNGFSTPYDFTSAATQAFGNNLILEAGKYCIYGGDINRDGFVNLTDIISDLNDGTNFVTGYTVTDINGDNVVNLTDLLIVANNSNSFVKILRP